MSHNILIVKFNQFSLNKSDLPMIYCYKTTKFAFLRRIKFWFFRIITWNLAFNELSRMKSQRNWIRFNPGYIFKYLYYKKFKHLTNQKNFLKAPEISITSHFKQKKIKLAIKIWTNRRHDLNKLNFQRKTS